MVHMDDHNCIVLAIHNFAHGTVQIAPGQTIGELHAVDEVSVQALEKEITVNAVSPLLGDCEVDDSLSENDKRLSEILDALSLNSFSLLPSQQEQLQELIAKFQTLFTLHSFELGCTDVVQHSIDTDGHPPIKQCARRVPFALRSTIDRLVDEMLQQGVIKPSKSPWASPVVLVAKKDGSMRFCIDYRKLNAITKKDVFPLPRIDNALDMLASARYFSTLDLASGYWQMSMDEDSGEKTAFTTHSGMYEFSVMPLLFSRG